MSRLGLALALLLVAPQVARADGETRPLTDDVDFSRPPSEVEGYNKARITCEVETAPDGKLLRVHGRAYYPDDVRFVVTLRYAKHAQPFSRTRAVVRDRSFSAVLGPFPKALPGGELVAEAWFVLAQQPAAMRQRLIDERYMSCSPPCRWDQRNATRVTVDLGGAQAQAQEERAEKEQLRRALDAITTALRVEEAVCLDGRQAKATPAQVRAALEQLEGDLAAAAAQLAAWRDGRQFTLFPARQGEVDGMSSAALEAGRLQAVVAGVPVDGVEGGQPGFERLARALGELRQRVEALRGFLSEEGSLDREWQALNDAARARFDATQSTDSPASGSDQGRR